LEIGVIGEENVLSQNRNETYFVVVVAICNRPGFFHLMVAVTMTRMQKADDLVERVDFSKDTTRKTNNSWFAPSHSATMLVVLPGTSAHSNSTWIFS
jgi:hypothetical protein